MSVIIQTILVVDDEYNHLGVKAIFPKPFNPLTLANQILEAVNVA